MATVLCVCRVREHVQAVLTGHDQEVCGLKWSPNGQQLASGGNDNLLNVWAQVRCLVCGKPRFGWCAALYPLRPACCKAAQHQSCLHCTKVHTCSACPRPLKQACRMQGAATGQAPSHSLAAHTAAVKALAWCPFQSSLLASGGGTADRTIRFWNTHTGCQLNSIDTESQVLLALVLVLVLLSPVLRQAA